MSYLLFCCKGHLLSKPHLIGQTIIYVSVLDFMAYFAVDAGKFFYFILFSLLTFLFFTYFGVYAPSTPSLMSSRPYACHPCNTVPEGQQIPLHNVAQVCGGTQCIVAYLRSCLLPGSFSAWH